MELEEPKEAVCPLCESHTVELDNNKNGRPKFVCSRFQTPVNVRGDVDDRDEFLTQFVADNADSDDEAAEVEQPAADDSDSDEADSESVDSESLTLKDLMNKQGGTDES